MASLCPACGDDGYDIEHMPPCAGCQRDERVRMAERERIVRQLQALYAAADAKYDTSASSYFEGRMVAFDEALQVAESAKEGG